MKENLIISLTSWSKRLCNIPVVLDTIWEQTVQPDKVVLNLAVQEFPNKELPQELIEYIDSHDKMQLNWVEHDTRVWKKFLPTFLLYPDAWVITIDDDILYPPTMIEDFMTVHKKFPDSPISGNHYVRKGIKCHCGCASLVHRKHFDGWQKFYKHKFRISCPSSDMFYTRLAAANGYFYVQTKEDYMATATYYNDVEGYSVNGVKHKLKVSDEAIYHKLGYEVVRMYNEGDKKPYCILGSAQTENGIAIEKEMCEWLAPNFNLIVVRHDGTAFEYTALDFLKRIMTRIGKPCFYVHTKGAYFTRKNSHRVRNMWHYEFVENQKKYLNAVRGKQPIVACPYSGSEKVTWYNGWLANAEAIRTMDLYKSDDRFVYEYKLFNNATVKGLRMSDVNRANRKEMHYDLRDNFD